MIHVELVLTDHIFLYVSCRCLLQVVVCVPSFPLRFDTIDLLLIERTKVKLFSVNRDVR